MAVSKAERTASIAGIQHLESTAGQGTLSAQAQEQLAPTAPPLSGAPGSTSADWSRELRVMREGFALLICFEVIYFVVDVRRAVSLAPALAIALHSLAVAAGAAILAATTSHWFERYWKPLVFAALLFVLALTDELSLVGGDTEPLLITVVLGLVGAAAVMPWNTRWQGAWSVAAAGAIAVPLFAAQRPPGQTAYDWFGMVMAAALAHLIVAVDERHRTELAQWAKDVGAGHQRLRQSESKLRKVLEASGDVISISRLSDGRYIDFNQRFCETTGYAREEALGRTALELGIWPAREPLREFLRRLRAEGEVRNLESTFRMKDGTLAEHLLSASLMELDGELCVVAASRDVSGLKRTQQRLAESEASLRRIFETSPDIIAVNRLGDGRFLGVNDEFVRVTGYSREEATAANARDLRLFKDQARLREYMHLLRTAGFVRNFEMELRTRDGSVLPHLLSATVINVGGEPCIISFVRDIGALKQTERELRATQQALAAQVEALHRSREQLREEIAERTLAQQQLEASENKLRKVFETSLDAIVISGFPDRKLLDCNPEFLAITGLSRHEALPLTIEELGIWPDREQYQNFLRHLREYGFVRGLEAEIRRRDGTSSPFLISATLTEIDGRPCVVKMARDISALKQTEHDLRVAQQTLSAQVGTLNHSHQLLRVEIAEREFAQRRLADSEAKFRRVFESNLDGIVIVDVATWRIVDCNAEFQRLAARQWREIVGRKMDELNVWASRRKLHEVTELVLSMGMVRNLEVEFRHSDGALSPYLFSALVGEIDGRPCVLAFARDISQLKRTERELIAAREAALTASQAKSEFLSSMSHEIRTPMNAILGMADLLWETPLSGEQRRYLHTMRANGGALLSLVNDILDLAKIESGRLSLEQSEFDLVELAESVMETLAIRAHEKGLELALRIRPEVPAALRGDPLRLRQILVNLIGNAIKFTERGEVTLTIEIAAAPSAPAMQLAASNGHAVNGGAPPKPAAQCRLLRFAVRDTGIGIPAEKLETIFSSFTQADSTTTRKYGGSGLGLAIVKRLVELKGGQLAVESRPGLGSTFSFVAPCEVPAGAAVCGAARDAPGLAGARMLVVDGSPAGRAIVAEMLDSARAVVTQAADGGAAIAEIDRARAAGRPYDIVLADCRMPAPDAIAIGEHLRAGAETRCEALVLMLTADDLPARLARLRALGFDDGARCRHLFKPIRRSELFAVIAAARAGAAPVTPEIHGTVAAYGTAEPARRRRRILLAEDSPDNRLVIEGYLRNTDYALDYAEDGESAVRKFVAGNYDAVLMDIQMPVMDGYAAAAEIRRWERENHRAPTPLIALSASAHEEDTRRSLRMGCDSHVTKPVKRSTLLKALDDAVETRAPAVALAQHAAPALSEPPAQDRHPAQGARADAAHSSNSNNCDTGAEALRAPIVVHLDQELSDLVPGFLARKRDDAAAVLAAAERGESEAISRLGHKLKGEGGGYGLDAISEIGRSLEAAASGSDFNQARRLARDLLSFLDRIEIVYQPMEE